MKLTWIVSFLSLTNHTATTRTSYEGTVPQALLHMASLIKNHQNPTNGDTYMLREVVDGMPGHLRFQAVYADLETTQGWT